MIQMMAGREIVVENSKLKQSTYVYIYIYYSVCEREITCIKSCKRK